MDTGKFWSPTWQPVMAKPKFFEARVGQGYTKIFSEYNNLESEVTYFVPLDENIEFWMVSLINKSKHKRHLRIYTYSELTLGDFHRDLLNRSFDNLFIKTWFKNNILYATKSRWDHPEEGIQAWGKTFFNTMNIPLDGYETMREYFVGEYKYLNQPEMVVKGILPMRTADSAETISSLCCDIELDKDESIDFDVMLGVISEHESAQKIRSKYLSHKAVQDELKKVNNFWEDYRHHFVIKTPDKNFNTSVNIWNRYQCWVTSQWSEMDSYYLPGSGVYGFRDEAQHIFGLLPHDQKQYLEKLSDLLTHQLHNGLTVHNWDTHSKKGKVTHHSDDMQWLAMAILNYLKETGDLTYLDQNFPFYDGEIGTVLEHLIKAIDYSLAHLSDRGLVLRQTADWNDALTGDKDGKSESLMVTNQLIWNIREMITILEKRDESDLAKKYLEVYQGLIKSVNEYGWDGKWYIYSTNDRGHAIGSHNNSEGMIHLNAQTWPIISGAAKNGRAKTAMASVWNKLMTAFGPAIFLPPYTVKNIDLGVIAQFMPGAKENGTIFLHTVSWSVIAECILGHGDKAFDIWKRSSFMTRGEDIKYKAEPYVYPEYMYGPTHAKFGQGTFTWITGSAAWFYRACTDWIIGIKPTLAGLVIDPCVPKKWANWSVERDFRNARYNINFHNPKHLSGGVKFITVDGKTIKGNLIPDFQDGQVHEVEVVLKR